MKEVVNTGFSTKSSRSALLLQHAHCKCFPAACSLAATLDSARLDCLLGVPGLPETGCRMFVWAVGPQLSLCRGAQGPRPGARANWNTLLHVKLPGSAYRGRERGPAQTLLKAHLLAGALTLLSVCWPEGGSVAIYCLGVIFYRSDFSSSSQDLCAQFI